MNDEADGDGLRASELVPATGGQWDGLLFDNPTLGMMPWLSWSFTFLFADVSRDDGSSPVSLCIEWVPLTTATWRDMAGQALRNSRFAEPAEASVYFFEHHRYDTVDLQVVEQHGLEIRVAATVSGDLDGLGVDQLTVDQWMTFAGIHVSLSTARSAEAASARLKDFTDVIGLSCSPRRTAGNFMFSPSG
ncbi:hypothetical protein [Actinophytocola sp.]|uniref:hypothetical protein n=1 Tax=Actinophytocola sp. TaxID=1872138 RepID=UPI003D6A0610